MSDRGEKESNYLLSSSPSSYSSTFFSSVSEESGEKINHTVKYYMNGDERIDYYVDDDDVMTSWVHISDQKYLPLDSPSASGGVNNNERVIKRRGMKGG
jgi:hypothetical protein